MNLLRTCSVLILLASCASANGGSNGDDGDGDDDGPRFDAAPTDDGPSPDLMPPEDMGPTAANLNQTTTNDPTSNNGLACAINSGANAGTTAENSWYRIYRLADAGITGPFTVSAVSFGIAISENSPTVTVKIGTYGANVATAPNTLDLAQITPIASGMMVMPAVASTAPTNMTIPVNAVVPANAQLIVEVTAPDYRNTKKFWIAGNTGGQSRPSWWRAPTCSTPSPVTTAMAGFGGSHIPITVTGTY